jgi:hypothetical protein
MGYNLTNGCCIIDPIYAPNTGNTGNTDNNCDTGNTENENED